MSEQVAHYPDLVGKRVLVTGASGGLGSAIAQAFAAQGAKVIVHYRSRKTGAASTVESIGADRAVAIRADLRSESAIQRLVEQSFRQWAGLDILVNNAGIVLKAAVLDADAEYWDDTLNINLRAPYLLSRAVAQRWVDAGSKGVILHNTSIHGHSSTAWFSAYAASKAALEMLTRVQAQEWAPHGIRVNAFAPGVVPVERTQAVLERNKADWMPHIPAERFGRGEDIANTVLFLASSAADWITGHSIVCDGGTLSRLDLPRRSRPDPGARPDPIEEG